MSTHKEKVLARMKELRELREWVEQDKKLKENLVLIHLPYGYGNDHIKIPAMISKEAFEQIQIFDEKIKEVIAKEKEENKEENKENQPPSKENMSDAE